ncbi:TatD family hydrolase [Paenibacillus sp. 481]|uniref:TatD family hydrolase n=1 Tax=Paenibacillus sp. 481 TaxID=2835869 RepID=UPI001E59FE11|nr:TatD family hydrolase [Paenibacillus sp. 481]UHA75581.1 TatD family hydrolase [Paenibacillus sp. 481]
MQSSHVDITKKSAYVDAHIHLDTYSGAAQAAIIQLLEDDTLPLDYVVAVSMGLKSSQATQAWARRYPQRVLPAYGFHPEQALPTDAEVAELLAWMDVHQAEMAAVGEVGLPYYEREAAAKQGNVFSREPYVELLEQFVQRAAAWNKPIVLHAVYDDAPLVCDLLERHNVRKAHFHWFKGDADTVERMAANGYFISFTPDITYEEDIQALARRYPITQVMTETDGPWPFEGEFTGTVTVPTMVRDVAAYWARLQRITEQEAAVLLRENARCCYGY